MKDCNATLEIDTECTVASVMFVAKISIVFGFDRNYTVIIYEYMPKNCSKMSLPDRKLRLRQMVKPNNLY